MRIRSQTAIASSLIIILRDVEVTIAATAANVENVVGDVHADIKSNTGANFLRHFLMERFV